jgi:hypothetical protein
LDLRILDPSEYPDWDSLLLDGRDYSFFHTSGWAKVLKESYGFRPCYFADIEKGRLHFLMPFMEVGGAVTGRRGVSLPFTDQCEPFALHEGYLEAAVRQVIDHGARSGWKSVEWRDAGYFAEGVASSKAYYAHDVNLLGPEPELLKRFSPSNRRNIKKALRVGIEVKIDQSADALAEFCRLNGLTRKRHGLPVQPHVFFKKVFDHIITKGYGNIVSASHSGKIVAASIFFHFGKKSIFKFGASDMALQIFRPNNLLMWEAIKWYSQKGYETMSLGRTNIGDRGLSHFKRTFGGIERRLKYYRYDIRNRKFLEKGSRYGESYRRLLARAPISVLRLAGRLFYRHAG